MATDMKRFTISVTDEMEEQLDRLKQAKYYKTTKNKMIQELISLGLETMQKELDSIEKFRDSANRDTRADP